jgi:histidine triad (HIT) family protein
MEERPCVFCQIAAKRIPAKIVYEDDVSMAFLDINPANTGHLLLIPKQHFETVMDIPPELFKEMADSLQRVATGLFKAVQAQGLNILQNNKEIAGQIIPHAHFHLIPRYKDDGLQLGALRQGKIEEETFNQIAEKIKEAIPPKEEKKEEAKVEEEKKEEEKEEERSEEETFLIRRELELT